MSLSWDWIENRDGKYGNIEKKKETNDRSSRQFIIFTNAIKIPCATRSNRLFFHSEYKKTSSSLAKVGAGLYASKIIKTELSPSWLFPHPEQYNAETTLL